MWLYESRMSKSSYTFSLLYVIGIVSVSFNYISIDEKFRIIVLFHLTFI